MLIAENVKQLCVERGITFAELERQLGLGNGVIARWGGIRPRVDRLKLVADYFGVTVDELLREEECAVESSTA